MPDNQRQFKVTLDPDFLAGLNRTRFFSDFNALSSEELYAIATFIRAVEHGDGLPGKNKESWLSDSLDFIPGAEDYRDMRYWHYHSGPSVSDGRLLSMTYGLQRNLHGLTSSEVIHYQKNEEDREIIIVGFSPEHVPFPSPNDPDNLLFS